MKFGVLAQLVERLNGIEEVGGSIPPGSMFLIVTEGLTPKRDPGGLFPIGGLSGNVALHSRRGNRQRLVPPPRMWVGQAKFATSFSIVAECA
jgi:hypothetical protein